MNILRHFLAAIAFAVTLTACIDAKAKITEMPRGLIGTWKVTRVYWRHNGPWPDGTPRKWFLGMLVNITKNNVTAKPVDAKKNDVPPLYLDKISNVGVKKYNTKSEYYVPKSLKNLLLNGKILIYSLSFKDAYRDYSFGTKSMPCHYCTVPGGNWDFCVISRNRIGAPDFSGLSFLVLTRISGPAS